jgi:hypothetical protein
MKLSVNEMVKIDESVVEKYHNKFINSLKERGWALYKTDSVVVNSLDELEELVLNGSEEKCLEKDTLYQVLPFVEENNNWEEIKKVMKQCLTNYRLPCFIDISPDEIDDKGNESLKAKNVYIIDSIYFDEKENMFVLVPDYDLMFFLGVNTKRQGNILLSLPSAGEKIMKQFTKCCR